MPSPNSFWHRLLDFLSRPPLRVRLLEAQLERANGEIRRLSEVLEAQLNLANTENRRLSDLLTQAWEARGVIPVQGDHRETASPVQVQRKSYAEVEAELTKQDEADHQAWLVEEAKREKRLKEIQRFRNPVPTPIGDENAA